jgi:hypothetical protein
MEEAEWRSLVNNINLDIAGIVAAQERWTTSTRRLLPGKVTVERDLAKRFCAKLVPCRFHSAPVKSSP